MTTDFRCTVCWRHATDLCGRCKVVRYCGLSCQRDDWKTHKVLCGIDLYPAKDLTVKSYRGLFFPEDEERPRFIEILVETSSDSEQPSMMPSIRRLLGGGNSSRSLSRSGIQNRERELMRGQLVLHAKPDGISKVGRTYNLSLRKFLGLPMESGIMGPVVVTKRKKSEGNNEIEEFMDIEVDDLRDAVDFLRFQTTYSAMEEKIFQNFNIFDFLQ